MNDPAPDLNWHGPDLRTLIDMLLELAEDYNSLLPCERAELDRQEEAEWEAIKQMKERAN